MSDMPALGKVKTQYHVASDTHYVVAWFWGSTADESLPDISIKIEKAGWYLDDTDTREEIARKVHSALTELIPEPS